MNLFKNALFIIGVLLLFSCSSYRRLKTISCPDGVNCKDGSINFYKNKIHLKIKHKKYLKSIIYTINKCKKNNVYLDFYIVKDSAEYIEKTCLRFQNIKRYILNHVSKNVTIHYYLLRGMDDVKNNNIETSSFGCGFKQEEKGIYLSGPKILMEYNDMILESLKGRIDTVSCCN